MTKQYVFTTALAALILASGGVAHSQDGIDFGNDDSSWSNDGECDDPRFELSLIHI